MAGCKRKNRVLKQFQTAAGQSRTALKGLRHRHKRDSSARANSASIAATASTTIAAAIATAATPVARARAIAGSAGVIRTRMVAAGAMMLSAVGYAVGRITRPRIVARSPASSADLARSQRDPHQTCQHGKHDDDLQYRRRHERSPVRNVMKHAALCAAGELRRPLLVVKYGAPVH